MAKTKEELIKEGKELGLNLKSTMSMYEIQHRIKDKKAELDKVNKKSSDPAPDRTGGEY